MKKNILSFYIICIFLSACASGQVPLQPNAQPLDSSYLKTDGKAWTVTLLAAHPANPGRIYAQILDMRITENFPPEAQILFSDDLGKSWLLIPTGDFPNIGNCASRFALDFQNPNILYVPTCGGLYKWSENNWELVTPQMIRVMDISSNNPNRFWASKSKIENQMGDVILKSEDSGKSWATMDDSLVKNNETVSALFTDSADENILYAKIMPNPSQGFGYLLRRYNSTDNSWNTLSLPDDSMITEIIFDKKSNSFYVTTLDYTNPNSISKIWHSETVKTSNSKKLKWSLLYQFPSDGKVEVLSVGWNPNESVIYTQIQDYELNASFDGGKDWSPISIP